MSQSVNHVHLIGRLGQDPETRHTSDGQAVTKLSLATDRPAKPSTHSEPDWHSIVCWQKLAEFAGQYLQKGSAVYAEGRLRTS